jgi:transcriptional regulator with PAS, ATPase and Fis domain
MAATNRDIRDSLKSGQFRQDLFFRLNVVSLHIPPLADRREDIPLLAHFFLRKYSSLMRKNVTEIAPAVFDVLADYGFPGNVQELENIIERTVALANGSSLEAAHLPEYLKDFAIHTFRKQGGRILSLEQQESNYIKWVLREVGGNKALAARTLGIDRVSLWRKLKRMGMEE